MIIIIIIIMMIIIIIMITMVIATAATIAREADRGLGAAVIEPQGAAEVGRLLRARVAAVFLSKCVVVFISRFLYHFRFML